jgi:glyoxylase-like metal-dependent hydrolase (beta-lactamase superfamily II)
VPDDGDLNKKFKFEYFKLDAYSRGMTEVTRTDGDRLRRPGRLRSIRLGDTTVTYVPDGAVTLVARGWFPDASEATWMTYRDHLDESGSLVAGIGGLLVERDGRALLIDAGYGPAKAPAQPGTPVGAVHGGSLLDNLTALGRDPASIEAVAITHLHTDHIGWAWQPVPGGDRPAFAAADYLIAESEWAKRRLSEAAGTSAAMLEVLGTRVRTIADSDEIFPGVRALPAHGHTVGHTGFVITDGGRRLIAFGDALHSPLQIGHPELSAVVDYDPAGAATVRRRLVEDLARPATVGFGVHFADVVFGEVALEGDRPSWHALDD